MTNDPWALPAHYLTIILKREEVAKRYPGGTQAFETKYNPAHKNGALYALIYMSSADVDFVLSELEQQGLLAGETIALGDMVQGPLVECTGVSFTCNNEHFIGGWSVNVAPQPTPKQEHHAHRIRAWYVHELVADHGDLSTPIGNEQIALDAETLSSIRSGVEVELHGPRMSSCGDEELPSTWVFNLRGPGSGLINLWRLGDPEPERLEVTSMQFDDDPTVQPAPPIWPDPLARSADIGSDDAIY